VTAAHTKHKFAWYYGDPKGYAKILQNNEITGAQSSGGIIEIKTNKATLLFNDGVNLRYFDDKSLFPEKHQLLLEFKDGSILFASVQMYGGLICFRGKDYDNKYYKVAKEKPSPLSKEFDKEYFDTVLSEGKARNLSLKALLATEQRIPGLDNGVLQDILFNAKLHPKQKIDALSEEQMAGLFKSIKTTLKEMVKGNGRNTEKDLSDQPGRYRTKLSKHTVGKRCSVCSSLIKKGGYLGGSIYYCEGCQPM
jgi:formamidopyrimidine-DNA glycosylase